MAKRANAPVIPQQNNNNNNIYIHFTQNEWIYVLYNEELSFRSSTMDKYY